MSRLNDVRRFASPLGSALVFSLCAAVAGSGDAHAQRATEAATPAKPEAQAKSDAAGKKTAEGTGTVKQNVKELGREVSDPSTLQRIKAHEQNLEKRVERRRDRQRKDHGTARPSDAVDLAKNLDKPGGATPAAAKSEGKTGAKGAQGAPGSMAR
jgi:molecular chaperone GrpE (heat shock protein)